MSSGHLRRGDGNSARIWSCGDRGLTEPLANTSRFSPTLKLRKSGAGAKVARTMDNDAFSPVSGKYTSSTIKATLLSAGSIAQTAPSNTTIGSPPYPGSTRMKRD
jgi:hypothetical protein